MTDHDELHAYREVGRRVRKIREATADAPTERMRPEGASEPKSELARYAFGYSDKRPSRTYWVIIALMIVGIVAMAVGKD